MATMTNVQGKVRLALLAGLREGDRAVELSDRIRDVLADEQFAHRTVAELLAEWPEDEDA